jgi:dTMP kinase
MESRSVEHRPVSFVTVEGIEGCGKSTLVAGLSERLRGSGKEIIVTREPGGTRTSDAIRGVFLEPGLDIAPLTEAFLVNAARAQHVLERIGPALAGGALVVCDRFVDSTLAYQGYGRGVDLGLLGRLCEVATGGLVPDITLVLDLPVPISRRRLAVRAGLSDRMELEDEAFHERVREGFLTLARSSPRYHVIDAAKTERAVLEEALAALAELLA